MKGSIQEKAKKRLTDAFLEVYKKNGLSGVTVGAISKKAGYNRCTFYNYYDDIQSLLCEIEDELLRQIQADMNLLSKNGFLQNIDEVLSQLISSIDEYGSTVYILLSYKGDTSFYQKLNDMAKEYFREAFGNSMNEAKCEYVCSFVVSAALGLMEQWYQTNKAYSTEEFINIVRSLVLKGVLGTAM